MSRTQASEPRRGHRLWGLVFTGAPTVLTPRTPPHDHHHPPSDSDTPDPLFSSNSARLRPPLSELGRIITLKTDCYLIGVLSGGVKEPAMFPGRALHNLSKFLLSYTGLQYHLPPPEAAMPP